MCQMLLLGEKNVGHSMTPIRPKLHALGVFGEKLAPTKQNPYCVNASSLIPQTKKSKKHTKKKKHHWFCFHLFFEGMEEEWKEPLIFPFSV